MNISINYSLYGMNEVYDSWYSNLFFKNDGYQAPIVFNPQRVNGNINVQVENHLAQSRLLSNLVLNDSNDFIKNIVFISEIKFSFDYKIRYEEVKFDTPFNLFEVFDRNKDVFKELKDLIKIYIIISKKLKISLPKRYDFKDVEDLLYKDYEDYLNRSKIDITKENRGLSKIFEFIGDEKNRKEFDNVYIKYFLIKYTINKFIKISTKYGIVSTDNIEFEKGKIIRKIKYKNLEKAIEEVCKEDSNIILKLKQAVHSVNNGFFDNKEVTWYAFRKSGNFGQENISFYTTLKWDNFKTIIKSVNNNSEKKSLDKIQFIPLMYFKPELYLKKENNEYKYISLSSGYLHSTSVIQTVLYHLSNLNSLKRNSPERVKYFYVNIILDEVELYFHPEFQRTFINELISRIKSIEYDALKGINILLSTHSPFILSDIPAQNILRLDDGNPIEYKNDEQTFGANIHSLLTNEFFLESYMGEFAGSKIKEVVDNLNLKIYEKEIEKINSILIGKIDKEITKELNEKLADINKRIEKIKNDIIEKKINSLDYTQSKNIIDIIGEPILKHKLNQMLFESYEKQDEFYEIELKKLNEKFGKR